MALTTYREIKEANPMPDVLARYGIKVKRGKCLCPFHNDHNASMMVKPDNYYCWVCNKGGDVFDFVMEYEHCTNKEAFYKLGGEDNRLSKEEKEKLRKERARKTIIKNTLEGYRKEIDNLEKLIAKCECYARLLGLNRTTWTPNFEDWLEILVNHRMEAERKLMDIKDELENYRKEMQI